MDLHYWHYYRFDVKIFYSACIENDFVLWFLTLRTYTVHCGINFNFLVHICDIVHVQLQLKKTVSDSQLIEHP